MRIDADTRRIDPRSNRSWHPLAAVHEVILIASSDGTLTADVRLGARHVSGDRRAETVGVSRVTGGGARKRMNCCAAMSLLRWSRGLRQARSISSGGRPAGAMTVVLWVRVGRNPAARGIGHAWKAISIARVHPLSRTESAKRWRRMKSPVETPGGFLDVDDEHETQIRDRKGVLRGYIQDK